VKKSAPETYGAAQGRGRRWLALLAIVILAVLFGGSRIELRSIQAGSQIKNQAEVDKRLALIRAKGEPVTGEDLAKRYPDPPPERDAARLLKPTLDALQIPDSASNLPLFDTIWPKRGVVLDPGMLAGIESLLRSNAAALSAFPKSDLNEARVGWGYPAGLTNNTGGFLVSPLLNLGKVLCLQAVLEAESGHGSAPAQAVKRTLAVAHVMRGGTFIHHLARRIMESQACRALEHVLNRMPLFEADLGQLGEALADDAPDALKNTLINMRCWGVSFIRLNQATPAFGLPVSTPEASKASRMITWLQQCAGISRFHSDALAYLDSSAERIHALSLPPKERLARLHELDPSVSQPIPRQSLLFWVVGSEAKVIFDWAADDLRIRAQIVTARSALAIERWRLAHEGRLPDSLSQLVPDFLPAVPADSFDEQPLRYRKLAHGYVVYSIGPDFTDDGGKERPTDSSESDRYDITFTVER
jgi:hypothetical protein